MVDQSNHPLIILFQWTGFTVHISALSEKQFQGRFAEDLLT